MLVSPSPVRLAVRTAMLASLAGFTILLTAGADVASSAGGTAAAAKPPAIFVSTKGSDARSCRSPAESCVSFQRAYSVARAGEIVEVAGGSYTGQSIRAVGRRSGPNVVFRPAVGTRVVLGGLTLGSGGDMNAGPGPRYVPWNADVVQGLCTRCSQPGRNLRRTWIEPRHPCEHGRGQHRLLVR